MTSIFVAAAMAALIDLGDTSIYRRMRLDRDGRALRGGARSPTSACMPRCAAAPISVKHSNTCVVTSPARRLPTNGSNATAPGKSCCS